MLIEGKETGIGHLEWIFREAARHRENNDAAITGEILKRVKQCNYVPTKKQESMALVCLRH